MQGARSWAIRFHLKNWKRGVQPEMSKAEDLKGQPYATASKLLDLARMLVASRAGLTIKEMAEYLGCSRRVAQRYRGALQSIFTGQLTEVRTDIGTHGEKRWRIEPTDVLTRVGPTADELAVLHNSIRMLEEGGHLPQAGLLRSLAGKIEAAQKSIDRVRVEADLERLLEAEGIAQRPHPHQRINIESAGQLREAIKASRKVILHYTARSTGRKSKPLVTPYGFLLGHRQYLVAFNLHPDQKRYLTYVLENIERVDILDETFERDEQFSLSGFASRSFGVWHDPQPIDVELRFSPAAAADARTFHFHPSQQISDEPDGSVTVTFRASGMLEMCWHIFTWGENVEIVEPISLKSKMLKLLHNSSSCHIS